MVELSCQAFLLFARARNMSDFAELAPFSFIPVDFTPKSLESREMQEKLMQWGLNDNRLSFSRFRFDEAFGGDDRDYDRLLKDFVRDAGVSAVLNFSGSASIPVQLSVQSLRLQQMSMTFFDRLTSEESNVATSSGSIRGCFTDYIDEIEIDNLIRDLLVNPDSEHAGMYSEAERDEFLFRIFKILVIGGTMCQPETILEYYLSITKSIYKDIVTVFKNEKDGQVQISGKAFELSSVGGLQMFESSNPRNLMFVLVDPVKKYVTVVKNTHSALW